MNNHLDYPLYSDIENPNYFVFLSIKPSFLLIFLIVTHQYFMFKCIEYFKKEIYILKHLIK